MSVPASTAVAGTVLTAAFWNAQVRDNINALISKFAFYVDGQAVRPDLTNGCDAAIDQTLTASQPLLMGAGFSGTADQFAQFKIPLPKAWNASTVTFRVRWTSVTAGAGNVVWSLQGAASSDGDAINQAYGTAVNVTDAFTSTNKEHVTAESAAVTIAGTPAKQDTLYFRVARLATNVSDTKVEKCYLLGVEIFVTTDALNDA